jgi:tetratricopeptide (TPR) repeat protein
MIDSQEGEDFLQLTDELAKEILALLRLPVETRSSKIPTLSDVAYEYYMLGRSSERKYKVKQDIQDFMEAVKWYEKAIEKDRGFALAYWGLGDTYQSLYVDTQKPEDLEQTLLYYKKAYTVDSHLAGANAGLGWAHFLKGDNDKAFQYFKKALELAAEDPSINSNAGSFLRSIGLPEQAIKYYSNAINFGEPSEEIFHLRAVCYEHIGKTEKSVADARQAWETEPENLRARLFYARELIFDKKYNEAERVIAVVERLDPDNKDLPFTRALLLAVKGEKEKALALIKEAEKGPLIYTYLLSRVYAVLGLKDKAIENIRLSIERSFQEVQDYSYEYPLLVSSYFYNSLRDDPRFIEILREQKKKYEDTLAKYGAL